MLGALTALGPLSIDAYLPAVPMLEREFAVRPGSGSISLSAYFLGLACAQLGWGVLADRRGRRPALLWGLGVYVVGSLLCGAATNLPMLALARLVQGVGGAASMVITRAIVRDTWSGREVAKVMSLISLIMGVAPILAPLGGGALLAVAGWRSIFAILSGAGCVLWGLSLRLISETKPAGAAAPLGQGVSVLLRDRAFLAYTLAGGGAAAGMFAYISGAPSVFITQLGTTPTTFALFFGLNASGLIAFSQWNRVLLERRTPAAIVRFGVGLEVVAGAGLVLVAVLLPRVETIAPCLWCFVASLGVVTPNTVALGLESHGPRAGLASALMGSLQFAVSATASALVSLLANQTAVPMAAVMLGCAVFAAIMVFIGARVSAAH